MTIADKASFKFMLLVALIIALPTIIVHILTK